MAPISISCIVTHAIDEQGRGGSVRCIVHNATSPLQVDWVYGNESALVNLTSDRMHATDVRPGEYSIIVHDAEERVGQCVVTVHFSVYPAITGYNVIDATCDAARDGQIEVVARNLHGHKFLWNNGVITVTPVLLDVPPGQYTATPLHEDDPCFIHACGPAIVRPSRNPAGGAGAAPY
tara:strand:+ start:969 stop:1502 length:534 start_codon:yes stop_codon:yes gene_type:complete